ncbi:hypothetical protein Tco_0047261 [Tanacetum coccineum]
MVFHNKDGNPARANIKQALGSYERPHKGVKASANSDVMYFFTSAQDGDPLQDDVRLCLGDDLKKAQDHTKHIEYLMLKASPLKYVKRGRDTKIHQSSGPPVKVGDEAIHKELGDRMERAVNTASFF